ncbi:CMRF35-like molecule 9 [Octodon degus]|uniref:CMRF35-like molecule 9 n=1 Tax=Octodon degus TaxID=10160 RepID=A0A6P6EUA8_OCTDE|nr:CMRF35-like molecule 9 [Octodon degus]XP_023575858.1 CMRF35-like molecule 9 [Octodon degus]
MAQVAPCLLCPVLLVLLTLGAWAQCWELLKLQEGETLSVRCEHGTHGRRRVKAWCRQRPTEVCDVLVTSGQTFDSRCSIKDFKYSFEVTMTELRVQDSGSYHCGFLEDQFYSFKIVHLTVSKAPTLHPTRSTPRTMTVPAPASASSPATDSPPGGWQWKGVVVGVVVAILLLLLLLGLSVLMALYLRRAQGGAQKGGGAGNGERDVHHVYEDLAAPKESADFEHPVPSDQDTGTVHYASLTHLSHSGTEDPTDYDSRFLSVEYASIAGRRPQPSAHPALEGEPRK